MSDTLTVEERSERMRRVPSKGSKPEMLVRKLVFSLGYRYRLHRQDLPGHPDIVFSRTRKVIFVHGCFWHRHPGCKLARLPKSKLEFWVPKLEGNKLRDKANIEELLIRDWKVLVVWECEIANKEALKLKITDFLN